MESPGRGPRKLVTIFFYICDLGEEDLAFGQVGDELGPEAPDQHLVVLVLSLVEVKPLFPGIKLRIVLQLP